MSKSTIPTLTLASVTPEPGTGAKVHVTKVNAWTTAAGCHKCGVTAVSTHKATVVDVLITGKGEYTLLMKCGVCKGVTKVAHKVRAVLVMEGWEPDGIVTA